MYTSVHAFILLTLSYIVYSQPDYDAQVLILGAGFSGIGAAKTLSERGIDDYLIIEARDVIGGRAQSVKFGGATVELGPQWVLGADLDPTIPEEMQHPFLSYVRRCNITLRDIPLGGLSSRFFTSDGVDITGDPQLGDAFRRYGTAFGRAGSILNSLPDNVDIPLSRGLSIAGWLPRTPLEERVEYVSWDLPVSEPTDTLSFRDVFDPDRRISYGPNAANYIVIDPRGYVEIARCIADEFLRENDPRLLLSSTVSIVNWSDEGVCVNISKNGEDRQYCAPYAILTFGIGVLQSDAVTFVPELPLAKRIALNMQTMIFFVKVYALFNETFWDTDVDLISVLNPNTGRGHYPGFTPWGARLPGNPPILEAFLSHDDAFRVRNTERELIKREIGEVLRSAYGERASDPIDIIVNNFVMNPLFHGNIARAAPGFSRDTIKELNKPLGRLYLAGEGLIFTPRPNAHGAFLHGMETGNRVADEILITPPQVTFINNTPRIDGNNVTAEFRISKPVESVQCSISAGERIDCSSGRVTFSNLQDGSYQLRVIARNSVPFQRAVGSRNLFISSDPHCAVHLINRGVTVYNDNAKVEFDSSGLPVSGFSCRVDSRTISPCTSPLQLRDLSPGRHAIRIRPMCDGGRSIQRNFSLSI